MAQYSAEVFHSYDKPHYTKPKTAATKTITEARRELPVFRETDIIVVGGGPGGVAAAVAAARGGARTILLERYGHLGGMSTGGLVNIIPNLSSIFGEHLIGGFCQEFIDRLASRGAASFPEKCFWGKSEAPVVENISKPT
jgi:NADPH-dependent 2,4-dienoyl-CoA reductase/sulfur reductase-like enzyme